MTVKLGNDTIVIRTYPLVTDSVDNTKYRDYTATPIETTVKFCNVQPFLLTDKLKIERSIDREYSEDTWRVWAPVGTVVEHTDRVLFRGVEYEVRGLTGEWRDFEARDHHVNFMIRKRIG